MAYKKKKAITIAEVKKLYYEGVPTYLIAEKFNITEAKVIALLGL